MLAAPLSALLLPLPLLLALALLIGLVAPTVVLFSREDAPARAIGGLCLFLLIGPPLAALAAA